MTVLGGDAFGVELDAVDRQLAMAEPHDRAIVARRVDREDGGNVDDLPAVIARRGQRRGQVREQAAAVMTAGCVLAVPQMAALHPAADMRAARLTAQAER